MVAALAIDIETVPTAAALAEPYPEADRNPPANYSKPESIAAWREKDRAGWEQERVKQYSLSPLTGRVVAVGLAWQDGPDVSLEAPQEGDEPALLKSLWDVVKNAQPLVTWNGFNFDVPFLLTRSAILRVATPSTNLLRRYTTETHYDVRQVVNGWQSTKPGTLEEWAKAFGFGGKVASGADVYPMYQRGEIDAIGQYAADDARKAMQLYERVSGAFG